MNTLTDDELTALLARTFSEHESLATADGLENAVDATRSRPDRRRPIWLVAAVAAVLVAVAGIGWVTGQPEPRRTQFPGTASSSGLTPRATFEQLKAAAEDAVETAVQSVRMPPGASEFPRNEISPSLRPLTVQARGRYWSVPGTVSTVALALATTPPPGMTADIDDPGVNGDSRVVVYGDSPSPGPVPAIAVTLVVSPTDRADEVRVLATAETELRPARPPTTFADGGVRSIDVSVIREVPGGEASTALSIPPGDRLDALVATFNRLFADVPGRGVPDCEPAPTVRQILLVHAAVRDLRVTVAGCADSVSVDGVPLDATNSGFTEALSAALVGLEGRTSTVP